MKTIQSTLLCMLSACAVLGACNACSPAQNAALKASFPTDEKCVATRVLTDIQGGLSWENTAIDVVATCGEGAVVAYEADLAAASDAGANTAPAPSLIAAFRARKPAAK